MIPISDSIRSRTFPFVNYTLILINLAVFVYELTLSQDELARFFFEWGVTPEHVTNYLQGDDAPGRTPLTLFSSMFMHGGWLHFLGNMLFLWIFGDNVEDATGHKRYVVFYLLGGLAASAAQVGMDTDSTTPAIGASGAISAVMGAYLFLYPTASVAVLLPILLFWAIYVPAFLLIGVWFLLQLLSGVAALQAAEEAGAGGVAWFAHIGGFIFGLLTIWFFKKRRRPVERYRVFARGPWD